jgi:DNA-binding Lrp family transcriptional regulator
MKTYARWIHYHFYEICKCDLETPLILEYINTKFGNHYYINEIFKDKSLDFTYQEFRELTNLSHNRDFLKRLDKLSEFGYIKYELNKNKTIKIIFNLLNVFRAFMFIVEENSMNELSLNLYRFGKYTFKDICELFKIKNMKCGKRIFVEIYHRSIKPYYFDICGKKDIETPILLHFIQNKIDKFYRNNSLNEDSNTFVKISYAEIKKIINVNKLESVRNRIKKLEELGYITTESETFENKGFKLNLEKIIYDINDKEGVEDFKFLNNSFTYYKEKYNVQTVKVEKQEFIEQHTQEPLEIDYLLKYSIVKCVYGKNVENVNEKIKEILKEQEFQRKQILEKLATDNSKEDMAKIKSFMRI